MIRNRLSRLMGERRVTVADLMRATGLSRTTLHDLYHDKSTRVDFTTLDKLCSYFGVDTQQLLEWQPGAEGPEARGGSMTGYERSRE